MFFIVGIDNGSVRKRGHFIFVFVREIYVRLWREGNGFYFFFAIHACLHTLQVGDFLSESLLS